METTKVIKSISINGINVDIELSEDEARKFPKRLQSSIKIKDKRLIPISLRSIFL